MADQPNSFAPFSISLRSTSSTTQSSNLQSFLPVSFTQPLPSYETQTSVSAPVAPVNTSSLPPHLKPQSALSSAVAAGVVKPAHKDESKSSKKKKEKKTDKDIPAFIATRVLRKGGGEKWEDMSLAEWPEDDYRLFVGNLGKEVDDRVLLEAFHKRYPSAQKARAVFDSNTTYARGYGFVSFSDPADYAKAYREMNGKYIGNRPCLIKKSNWKERIDQSRVKKKKAYEKYVAKKEKKHDQAKKSKQTSSSTEVGSTTTEEKAKQPKKKIKVF